MPHKHRIRTADESVFDLPPTAAAKPLPVRRDSSIQPNQLRAKKRKPPRNGLDDDTPKTFARLMRFQTAGKRPSGLDNGDPAPRAKKRKHGQEAVPPSSSIKPAQTMPTILPGERLADFSARVDQALPVAGLARKGKNIAGIKEKQTKMEKRLQKMQNEWRKEEARIREREEEERELAEEEEDEQDELYGDALREVEARGKKGKKKRGRMIGEDGVDDDPWAVLRAKAKPIALHDVVQAPPQLKSVPKEKFKVRDGAKVQVADIPNAAGSLRRREELGETRKSIIERYRQMMESKRSGG